MQHWGQHLILNIASCDKELVTNKEYLRVFVQTLVKKIDMKAFGEPIIEHFGKEDLAISGYSVVQLIETSAITGHFVDCNGDAYLDIFSCKEFDVDVAIQYIKESFHPEHIDHQVLFRQAFNK